MANSAQARKRARQASAQRDHNMSQRSELRTAIKKVRKAIGKPYVIDCHPMTVSCSIGIALYPQHGYDEITLAKNADDAMYKAKEAGRDAIRMADGGTGPAPADSMQ